MSLEMSLEMSLACNMIQKIILVGCHTERRRLRGDAMDTEEKPGED